MTFDSQSISFIIGIAGILAVIFSVYSYFKNPQVALDKQQAIAEKELDGKATVLAQQEINSKAIALAQQVQWEKELTEKRFIEMSTRITDVVSMVQSRIHSVDLKVDGLSSSVNGMSNEITKLATIIQERIPKS